MSYPQSPPLPPHLQLVVDAVEEPWPETLGMHDVAEVVAGLAAGLEAPSRAVPSGSPVLVDSFSLRKALQCPASLDAGETPEPPFSWSPHTSARWLGMRALESFVSSQVGDLSTGVMAAAAGLGSEGREAEGHLWGPPLWLRDQATGADRAAALASARQWAEQAAQWVPWDRWRDSRHRLRFDPARRAWPGKRSPVTVKARWEADLRPFPDSRSRVQILLLGVAPGGPEADALVRFAALGGWLSEPRAGHGPERVVGVYPASGEVASYAVDRLLLDRAVDEVVAAATTLVEAIRGHDLAAVPGPRCVWCPRSDGCEAGSTWMGRPDRRVAGIPVG